MAKNSSIEWTHHTFNPWWSCTKVSPACDHCYAETWAKRVGQAVWGAKAPRRFFTDKHWNEPLKWNAEASAEGFSVLPWLMCSKNWLFIGCREAGQKAAILYAIVENCRRLGIDSREYLEDVLTRLPAMMDRDTAQLTPANWLRAKTAAGRAAA